MTWGVLLSYQGRECEFRYEGGGEITLTVNELGQVELKGEWKFCPDRSGFVHSEVAELERCEDKIRKFRFDPAIAAGPHNADFDNDPDHLADFRISFRRCSGRNAGISSVDFTHADLTNAPGVEIGQMALSTADSWAMVLMKS